VFYRHSDMTGASLIRLVLPLAFPQVNALPAYKLDWAAEGSTFFDGWMFETEDATHGAVDYLDRVSAVENGVAQAFPSHAILRTGKPSKDNPLGRDSIRLESEKGWDNFLLIMKFSKVPYGCGLWPAFWLFGKDKPWPAAGELDIMEWVHEIPQQTSLHTAHSNRCKLDADLMSKYPDMPDLNKNDYDCETDYLAGKRGCAPNRLPVIQGDYFNDRPGVIAVEKTPEGAKVFHIPEEELPADVDSANPQPDGWDKWVVSYYPFAESEARVPGSCPQPTKVMTEQHIILNIELCGDWGSPTWGVSEMCFNKVGPSHPSECAIFDPRTHPGGMENDCCTQWIMDKDGKFGTEEYLRNNAFFNISFVRVFQQVDVNAGTRVQEDASLDEIVV